MNLRAALWMVIAGLLVGTNVSRADEGNLYFEAVDWNYMYFEFSPDSMNWYDYVYDDNYLAVNDEWDVGTADVTLLGVTQTQPDLQGLCGYTSLLQGDFINITGASHANYFQSIQLAFELKSDIVGGVPVHPGGTGATLYFMGDHLISDNGDAYASGSSEMSIVIDGTLRGYYENGVLTNLDHPNTNEFDIEVGDWLEINGYEGVNAQTASYSTGGGVFALKNEMTFLVVDVE